MAQTLGRYTIEAQLGEGSFAYVYRAKDADLDRYVALKVLKPAWLSDPAAIARFKQEARTMAKLDKNPHVAVVYEVGEAEGQVYLTQLFVDGETLADRLAREGPLPWPDILAILGDVASALDYAHSQGVIHRDIKPSNILLDKEGRAYLGDFGLVRAAEGSESLSASIGGVKGTAAYIPPEVWDAEAVTPATDIYALSCVVFEMLTGEVLFEGSSMMAVMRQHDKGPRFPAAWPESVPAGVTEVLQRGLAADPRERIQSGSELLAALAALSPAMVDEAEAPTIPPPPAAEAEGMWLVSSTGQQYPLRPGTLTMGRSAKCDIQVNDPLASRQHATLEFDGESCRVYDEGSANGTFVNGQQVTAAGRALQPGDQLRIGEMTFSLSATVPAAPVPAPPVDEAEATIAPAVDERAKTAIMPAMAVAEETAPPAPPPPAPQPRASSKGLLAGGALALIGGGVVLVVIVGAILFFVFRPPPTPGPETPSSGDLVAGMPGDEPTDTPPPTEEVEPTPTQEPTAAPTDTPEPEPTDTPEPTPLPQTITAPDGATMVLVPAGPFEMGSDVDVGLAECKKLRTDPDECVRSWFEREEPQHTVMLDDFYIDQYEVTNAQYATCVDDGACASPAGSRSDTRYSYYRNSEYDDYPVIWVNWERAKTYCEWRGARLPTEAEWEKAARGTDGRQYPWGDAFDGARTNFCDSNCPWDWANADYDDGYADTAPVGSYSNGTSPYGVHDMAGNVWEWVADWYDGNYYSSSPAVNPTGPSSGEFRVLRGGAWYRDGNDVRSADRSGSGPPDTSRSFGFRCARSP